DHYWTEQAVAASGLDFTLLRNHIYAEAVLMGAGAALKTGQMFDATDGKGRAYVSRADCARTAAGALLDATGREIHDVTGPAAVTQDEVARLLAQLAGKSITRIGVTPEQLLEGMLAAGLPPFMANLLGSWHSTAMPPRGTTPSSPIRWSGSADGRHNSLPPCWSSIAAVLQVKRALLAAHNNKFAPGRVGPAGRNCCKAVGIWPVRRQ
ncbi:MAG: NAD(P)-dependent oxidoreductase, partial [Devosia sp.]|nr:NAD(P)-dependent oxidoreductase [Devosia sp.]